MSPVEPVRLSIRGASYSYAAGDPVLEGIDLEVRPGTLTLVCGASGSGKSTVLRLLNGLIPHFHDGRLSGQVLVDGEEVGTIPVEQSGLRTATVFQNPASQFFTTRVGDELAFAPQNYQVPAPEIRRRRSRALAELGIEDLAERDLRGLSGGQVQKVACAQALAQATPVILMDEPTSNLDPGAIEDVRAAIERLKAAGRTLVVAEHRVYFLRGLVDEVVVMGEGRVLHRMPGEELWELDETRRVALGLRSLRRPRLASQPRRVAALAGGGDAGSHKAGQGPRPAVRLGAVSAAWTEGTGAEGAGATPPTDGDGGVYGLRVERLQVERGERLILDVPELFFPAGRVTGLMGANGIGKTTLARAICRLQRARRGVRVRLGGKPLSGGRAFLVMQDVHRQLFTESVAQEASAPQLERLDLVGLAERHPLSLSGGQKQRLVIATAIDQDARVVILDEPTSGVDHRHLVAIAAELRDLAAEGRVVIVISHDVEFLNECADDIVELV